MDSIELEVDGADEDLNEDRELYEGKLAATGSQQEEMMRQDGFYNNVQAVQEAQDGGNALVVG